MKTVILTTATCDNEYLDVFKAFLCSIRLNHGTGVSIVADLINGNEQIYEGLKKIYPNLTINHLSIESRAWTDINNTIHIMRQRPLSLLWLLEAGWGRVVSLDSDSIIRKPIDGLWNNVKQQNLKIWLRDEKKTFYKFQAGVFVLGNSPETRAYWTAFIDRLGKDWKFYDGQGIMYRVYLEHKTTVPLIRLGEKYNDCKFKGSSYIWHSKKSHLHETKFQDSIKKYLEKARTYEKK